MKNYQHKVAVITGAGGGIGRALAINLAKAGASLALSDINSTALAATQAALPENSHVICYPLDVADKQQMQQHAIQVQQDFGAVHYVFNNAGVTLAGTVAQATMEEIEWQTGINLWGVVYGTKAFLPLMQAQNEGCIVNMSSVFGLLTVPSQSIYCLTKFAVRGFTEGLARELHGSGVRACTVHPGGIRTEIGHNARFCAAATETEIAFTQKIMALLQTDPDLCARHILRDVSRGKNRILVGHHARLLDWLARLFPASYGTLLRVLRGL